MEIYEALCDGDVYWFGMYDDNSHTFTPFHETTNLKYDYGTAIAGKSFWDAHTSRRIQWSWVLEHGALAGVAHWTFLKVPNRSHCFFDYHFCSVVIC